MSARTDTYFIYVYFRRGKGVYISTEMSLFSTRGFQKSRLLAEVLQVNSDGKRMKLQTGKEGLKKPLLFDQKSVENMRTRIKST